MTDSPTKAAAPPGRGGGALEGIGSIAVPPPSAGFLRRLFAFAGPGYLVAVGYMDPGNWSTDIEAGSRFGYSLLSVVLISNLLAVLLQTLSVRLGVATGRDLARLCGESFGRPARITLWLMCETAICACDLAEVLGTAIALELLFGIPLVAGVVVTGIDVLLLLGLQRFGFRYVEAFVVALLTVIAVCFGIQLFLAGPDAADVLHGFVPDARAFADPGMLYVAIGILGATVMPHNLYLHSSIVQTRRIGRSHDDRAAAIRYGTLDTVVALTFALGINAAILIVAGSFHQAGQTSVAGIEDAYRLLDPLLGASMASTLFALALLASGQNSTVTATLAGQIVMEGFVQLRLKPWLRRLVTRGLAIVPAVIAVALYPRDGAQKLIVFSQIVLSLQLPFAVVPLVLFTASRQRMGEFVSPKWLTALSLLAGLVIAGLNLKLIADLL